MELRHLRYFCAVAREMHVTRAANSLRIAQPALTQQIKALEQELEVELLRRVGRRIELTAAGVVFRGEAEAILERVGFCVSATRSAARGTSGMLRIGLTESAAFSPAVSRLIKRAHERWPDVKVNLVHGHSIELVAALSERRIDIAFVRPPVTDEVGLLWGSFVSEAILVAMPKRHPLTAKRSIRIVDLRDEQLILPRGREGRGALRTEIFAALAAAGVMLRLVQEVPEFTTAINLVAAGMGLSLVPECLTTMRSDSVIYRPLRAVPTPRTKIVIGMREEDGSPTAANFYKLSGAS